jgi:hypothetical protein
MNTKILFCFILSLSLCNIFITSTSVNKPHITSKELEFAKKHQKNITQDFINFEIDSTNEISCKAAQDFLEMKVLFRIPKEYLICSYDYFPFKIELKDAIMDTINRFSSYKNETVRITNKFLFAYDLMFLKYSNKAALKEKLISTRQSSYVVNPSAEILEYLDSLPTQDQIYNRDLFDNEEKKLLQEILGDFNNEDLISIVFDGVINYIKTKHPKLESYILPWISDKNLLKYSLALISLRSYTFDLNTYEKIQNQTLLYMQMGYKQQEKLRDIYSVEGYCFLPVLDLCNKKILEPQAEIITPEFIPSPNVLKVGFIKHFHKGEEVYFIESGKSNLSNDQILYSYGTYVENNPNSISYFNMTINKQNFTPHKNELCKTLQCFDFPLDNYFKDQKINEIEIIVPVQKDNLNQRVLTFMRLFNYPEDENKIEDHKILHRLSQGKALNYDSEIKALAKYREDIIKNTLNKSKFKIDDVLNSIQITENYYKNNPTLQSDKSIQYKYNVRENIMKVAREDKMTLINNVEKTQKEIINILGGQFVKIKEYFNQ